MRIKLIANSIDAQNYISSLNENGCDYAYFHGTKKSSELTINNSWELKLFSNIEKKFFKNSISEQSKTTINYIYNAVNNLDHLFDQNESYHIDGMKVFLNVDSKFNKFLKLSTNYFSKFKKGLDDNSGEIQPSSKNMLLGLSLFNEDNKNKPFTTNLINKIGIKETIQFVVNHEASHSFEITNLNNEEFIWNDGISDLILLMKELKQVSYQNEEKPIMESINEEIKSEYSDKFPILDTNFINECMTLNSEIYADVSATLLMRNDSIKKNSYCLKKTSSLIDTLIESRRKEHEHAVKNEINMNNSLKYFHHCTTTGLEYLQSVLPHIPQNILSHSNIYKITSAAQKVGMSRIFLASALADNNYSNQLELIANINYNPTEKSLELPEKISKEKSTEFTEKIIEMAGKDWYVDFKNKIKHLEHVEVNNKAQAIWNAAINPPLYEKFITENKNIIDKHKAINSMLKIQEQNSPFTASLGIKRITMK